MCIQHDCAIDKKSMHHEALLVIGYCYGNLMASRNWESDNPQGPTHTIVWAAHITWGFLEATMDT